MAPVKPHPPLRTVMPPLIFGTATFNNLYNRDPNELGTTPIVHRALALGVRAFDTSPYYGPSETLLGEALVTGPVPRSEYFIVTKAGRIASDVFDYSPAAIRASVLRSCERLDTPYLDLVYCHDVEFVSPDEVLEAVRELRRLRDEGYVHYVGISGYPLGVLCELAERVRDETDEPLDAVMSYAHYTLQNRRLASEGLPRLLKAGVQVVPNASVLGMGLLRGNGVPVGARGDWHPAPQELREAVARAAGFCAEYGERLEEVSVRWALEKWLMEGGVMGVNPEGRGLLGVSVMGVSAIKELEETMAVWNSILDGLANREGRWSGAETLSALKREATGLLAEEVRNILGEWVDYSWPSPPEGTIVQKSQDGEVR
ncbi:Aldo/keto reductase [Trichodelitschia bisporula]|uniref:Aldo/keto reductase n=1 Tax=Trichodelitschia bisporula TaxID=703511 RepID=A0A6G1HR37_9PEZI|nr:Aldo/keto reductase [Trichodelitschia bisporula]